MIRNKKLANDDSERVRDIPREGLSLPYYSPCPSSEVGSHTAPWGPLAVAAVHAINHPPAVRPGGAAARANFPRNPPVTLQ